MEVVPSIAVVAVAVAEDADVVEGAPPAVRESDLAPGVGLEERTGMDYRMVRVWLDCVKGGSIS